MTSVKIPTKSHIYRQLKDCGVSKAIVKKILPAWWDDALLANASGLTEFSLLIQQRLGLSFFISAENEIQFKPALTPVQFKKRASTTTNKLFDATFLSQAVGKTLIRQLRKSGIEQNIEGLRFELNSIQSLGLESALQALWRFNIPAVYAQGYSASMARPAGIVMKEHGQYAIILSHKHKSPATQLFVLLHEVGHILAGHLPGPGTISDATISELGENLREEDDSQELEADQIALEILRKGVDIDTLLEEAGRIKSPVDLALLAKYHQKMNHINGGHLVLSYGRLTRNWTLAHQALGFIETIDAQTIFTKHAHYILESLQARNEDNEFLMKMLRLN